MMMTRGAAEARLARGLMSGRRARRGGMCARARDQLFLMPVCMRDWLEEGHLAWFVLDVVAELDTRRVASSSWGRAGASAV